MKDQFEVWRFDFGKEKGGEHPTVLISHPDICARSKVVNVLFEVGIHLAREVNQHFDVVRFFVSLAVMNEEGLDRFFCRLLTVVSGGFGPIVRSPASTTNSRPEFHAVCLRIRPLAGLATLLLRRRIRCRTTLGRAVE